MKRWSGWLLIVVMLAVAAFCLLPLTMRGKGRRAPQGQVVYTFPDGRQLRLLKTTYAYTHTFEIEQGGWFRSFSLQRTAEAWDENETLCLWLAIYNPHTNQWEMPAVKTALLKVEDNLYLPEEDRGAGASMRASGFLISTPAGGDQPPPDVPNPVPLLFALEPTLVEHAEARLWLNTQSEPIRFVLELSSLLPRIEPPSQALIQRLKTQQRGALTVEFRGLRFADYIAGDSLGMFLVPDLRVWHKGKQLSAWQALVFEISGAGRRAPFHSLSLPPANAASWAVIAYLQCYDPDELVRDAFADYVDIVVPAPRPRQVIPIRHTLQAKDTRLKVLALVGAGELRYHAGDPLPTQTLPLPPAATTNFQIGPDWINVVSNRPYLLCEIKLPWRPSGGWGANPSSLSFSALDSTDEAMLHVHGKDAGGKPIYLDHLLAANEVLSQIQSDYSLIALPLEPRRISGRVHIRLGIQRTRFATFLMPPLEAAQVCQSVRNALAWLAIGEVKQSQATILQCLRTYRQSRDPITLTYLGLLCTVADLPPSEFKPLIGRLRTLAQQEPRTYAYRLALGAALVRAGRPQEALPYLRALHDLHPSDNFVRLWYALALTEAGQFSKAAGIADPQKLQSWRDSLKLERDRLMRGVSDLLVKELEQKLALPIVQQNSK